MSIFTLRPFPNSGDRHEIDRWFRSLSDVLQSIISTDGVPEGSTNLYFTDARARAALSGTAPISYNSTTGAISLSIGNGLTTTAGNLVVVPGEIDHDQLLNFLSNEHIDWTNTTQNLVTSGTIQGSTVTGTTAVVGGSGGDTTTISNDGVRLLGTATQFRDELGNVTTLARQGSGVSLNTTQGAVEFTTGANLNDFLLTDVQRNHDAKTDAVIYPHIHCWLDQTTTIPNILIRYRWQETGGLKVTTWTDYILDTIIVGEPAAGETRNALISNTTGITPPSGSGVSPIIQFKLFRDNANNSGAFAGSDGFSGVFSITAFDVHVEEDSMGSGTEYVK